MKHEIKFALKVIYRDPETKNVVSVRCQFCVYFGKEDATQNPRKRARTDNTMSWTDNWRVDLFKNHHLSSHPSIWEIYNTSTEAQKLSFFDDKIAFKDTILTHFKSPISRLQYFIIKAPIVNILIGEMFFHPEDVGGITQINALKPFKLQPETGDYQVTITNSMQFELAVAHVADGQSFRQAASSIMNTRKIACISDS